MSIEKLYYILYNIVFFSNNIKARLSEILFSTEVKIDNTLLYPAMIV